MELVTNFNTLYDFTPAPEVPAAPELPEYDLELELDLVVVVETEPEPFPGHLFPL